VTDEADNDELAPDAHGLYDATWDETRWQEMAAQLVERGLVTWREITTTILGELNPPQVGTSIASADSGRFGFKDNHAILHPDESFMPYVFEWFYEQTGRCVDCETRLDTQADHVNGRENFTDPREADVLENMALRCRRHNVAKRKSHVARAGRTLLPAQQALMWILLEIRPVTLRDFARLCRIYGMTMADIRFQESWAMAVWLEREGQYRIARPDEEYDLVQWEDGAVTRRFTEHVDPPEGGAVIASAVGGTDVLCFLASSDGAPATLRYYELPVADIPFNYDLGDRPPSDIAIWPSQGGGVPLAPRGLVLHAHAVRKKDQGIRIVVVGSGPIDAPVVKSFRGSRLRGIPRGASVQDLSLVHG
jgi:hypothetical protein